MMPWRKIAVLGIVSGFVAAGCTVTTSDGTSDTAASSARPGAQAMEARVQPAARQMAGPLRSFNARRTTNNRLLGRTVGTKEQAHAMPACRRTSATTDSRLAG